VFQCWYRAHWQGIDGGGCRTKVRLRGGREVQRGRYGGAGTEGKRRASFTTANVGITFLGYTAVSKDSNHTLKLD